MAIKAAHVEMKARYGSPRIHDELVARGQPCCLKTVAQLMRQHGIAARTRREFGCTTDSNHAHPVAENIVDRDFNPKAANRAWTADITYVATGEGWPYLAVVEDLYSRQIVGWSMGSPIDSRLVVDALEMALARRQPGEGLVVHRPGGPVCQRPLSGIAGPAWDHLQHEPSGQRLGQRRHGELLRQPEEAA